MDEKIPLTEAGSATVKAKKKGRIRRSLWRFRPSRLLDAFTLWFYTLLTSGLFGTVFTAYSREEAAVERFFQKLKKQKNVHYQPIFINHRVARLTETFFCTSLFKQMRYAMLKCPFGYYSDAILFYAIVSLFSNYFVLFLTDVPALNTGILLARYALENLTEYLGDPIFWINVGLILLFSLFCLPIRMRSLHDVKMGSLILSSFFEKTLGTRRELTEELQNKNTDLENGVRKDRRFRVGLLLAGACAGVLSAFFSSFWIFLVPCIIFLGATVIRTPESGLILAILILPVLSLVGYYDNLRRVTEMGTFTGSIWSAIGIPTLILAGLILLTGISYGIKVLRRKRLFRFGLFDATVLLFSILILIYGVYPRVTAASLAEALLNVVFIVLYFLVVNLLRNEMWLFRVLSVLQFTVFWVLFSGIFVYVFGIPDLGWFPLDLLDSSIGQIEVFYGGADHIGAFLVLMLPLSLLSIFSSQSVAGKIWGAMCLPEILFTAFLLPTKLPAVFCIVGGIIFSLLCTYRTLYAAPILAGAAGVTYQLVPNGIDLNVFLRNLFYGSFAKPIYLWDRFLTLETDLSLMGIGFGGVRYSEFAHTANGFENAGFLMQLLVGMGIPGVSILLLLGFFFVQMALEELKCSKGSYLRTAVAGGFTAIFVLMLYGVFVPVLSDARMMFFLILSLGICVSLIRVSAERRNDSSFMKVEAQETRNADVVVY